MDRGVRSLTPGRQSITPAPTTAGPSPRRGGPHRSATVCWRWGRTVNQPPPHRDSRPPFWTAGHTRDSDPPHPSPSKHSPATPPLAPPTVVPGAGTNPTSTVVTNDATLHRRVGRKRTSGRAATAQDRSTAGFAMSEYHDSALCMAAAVRGGDVAA